MLKENKTVLVTGASRGIGLATALELSKSGYTIVGTSKTIDGLSFLSKKIKDELNNEFYSYKLDLNLDYDIEKFIRDIINNNHIPDIVVNNAGITKDNFLIRMKDEDWFNTIKVNLSSVFKISKAFVPKMIKNKWGRIVNISSVVGSSGNASQTNYCASKAGLIGFSKALACELGSRNITVNVVSPGFIETDMTSKIANTKKKSILSKIPNGSFGKASDIAFAVKFLISNEASYINGHTLHVNGGMYTV